MNAAAIRYYEDPVPVHARKILIVEDNRSDAMFVRRMLRDLASGERLTFWEVARLKDAIELLSNESFDLVILDLGLLDMDGVISVAAVRATAQDTPIVVYSGSDDPELRQEAILCGAHHYLVKNASGPMRFKMFIESVLAHAAQ